MTPAVELPEEPPQQLLAASCVFFRRDGHHGPLQTTWDGTYKVIQRSRHVFNLQVGSQEEAVSTHHLKAAHVAADAADGTPRTGVS